MGEIGRRIANAVGVVLGIVAAVKGEGAQAPLAVQVAHLANALDLAEHRDMALQEAVDVAELVDARVRDQAGGTAGAARSKGTLGDYFRTISFIVSVCGPASRRQV
jgi:hypothetical protein